MDADFVPDELSGKIIVYERPDYNRVDGYVACIDPAEDDDVVKTKDTSNLSLAIVAKPFGSEPAKLVLEYVDRPKKLVEFYQQTAYILMWYRIKANIELNKGGWRMLQWFQENYPELLAFLPASYNSAKGGIKLTHGYRITNERKGQLKGLGDAYVENYVEYIPSIRLIDELGVVGAVGKDDDLAMAFLACLMILQGDRTPVKNANEMNGILPSVHYAKDTNGQLQLVTQSGTAIVPDQPSILRPPQGDSRGTKGRGSSLFKGLK